jgi:hypothetical protein
MKTYITDIFPKIQQFSKKLDDLSKLSNQHWVSLDEIGTSKIVYIFRPGNQLIISENGIVERAKWEYLGNGSFIIETNKGNYLLRQAFLDDTVLAFKVDSTDQHVFFVNETKYTGGICDLKDVLELLERKYIRNQPIPKPPKISNFQSEFNGSVSLLMWKVMKIFFIMLGSIFGILFLLGGLAKLLQ